MMWLRKRKYQSLLCLTPLPPVYTRPSPPSCILLGNRLYIHWYIFSILFHFVMSNLPSIRKVEFRVNQFSPSHPFNLHTSNFFFKAYFQFFTGTAWHIIAVHPPPLPLFFQWQIFVSLNLLPLNFSFFEKAWPVN